MAEEKAQGEEKQTASATTKKAAAKKEAAPKPVWDVTTQGEPPEGREDQYDVVRPGTAE